MTSKNMALIGQGLPYTQNQTSGILVNGLPIELVSQWIEIWTKQSFAVSVSNELRRQYYKNDAEFSLAMRKAGYVLVHTRKLTGKRERFWLYRKTGNDKGVGIKEVIKINKFTPFVQYAKRPIRTFERIAIDGQWLYVYADHIRFLTKKRHRVGGVRVQGYTAQGIELREV
ncbi:hypothetical protein ID852_01195 [Xenorhabdus sp. 42]|nr:hypothetical protein [Xenorhabdus sp. 42]MBD2819332.1 hypothetical protein [Xenorhabdus sp. 42]